MGMNWDWSLVVGFVVDTDDLLMPFKQEMPEETHLEDRYDARTGEKVGQVTVVDKPARTEYVLDGKSYGTDESEFIEVLADEANCEITLHGDFCTGEDMTYSVEPKRPCQESLTFKEIAELAPEAERIRQVFKVRFGVDLGEPGVTSIGDYA
jgi:hypothetical protein